MRALTFVMLSGFVLYGQTAEAPKRTVFDSKAQEQKKSPTPESGKGASYRALDALTSSTEDMNVIRDSNVRRLTKDGCAPEVSARIADLRSKLPDGIAKSARADSAPDNSALVLASNWFKAASDNKSTAAPAKDKSIDLLDSVLPATAGKTAVEAKPTRPEDIVSMRAELEHLYAACPGAKR